MWACLATSAIAQIPTGPQIFIEASPSSPEPGETVTLSLNAYTLNTIGATINWYIDGVIVPSVKNSRSITYVAGSLGETSTIRVVLTLPDQSQIDADISLTPSRLNLVVEGETLVPSFYKGRSVPSPGSNIRMIALPETGTSDTPESLTYTWSIDGKPLYGGATVGRNVVEFEAPLRKSIVVGVDVHNRQGQLIISRQVAVPTVEPEVYFYESNPLRGLSRNVLPDRYELIGQSADIRAEHYYLEPDILAPTANWLLEWRINGNVVDNPSHDPQMINFQKTPGSGSFSVGFHIRNLRQVLQGAEREFQIVF